MINKKINIDNKKKVYDYLHKLLNKRKIENINNYAEIFTPPDLINLMLNDLPTYVWEKSNYVWLDLAAGIGNFSIFVYYKLLEGLKEVIPNIEKRKRHIIENMLFFSEINVDNIKIIKKIFGTEYKLNIHSGNSLTIDTKDIWDINKFDVIICNPPYHNIGRKSIGGKNANIHFEFSKKAVELLAAKGFMLFIQPRNWRSINSPVLNYYHKLTFIKLYLNYGRKYFKNAEVNTDYYLLQNVKSSVTTEVHYKYNRMNYVNNIKITKLKFIPNVYNLNVKTIIKKITTIGTSYKCYISSDCHKNKHHVNTKSYDHKYPLYNTSANPFTYYSSKPHIDQYKKKVIMSNSGKLEPFYDDGKYGTTQDAMYIIVNTKKEGDIIVKALNTNLFKFIIKICKWSNYRNDVKLFNYFKYPTIMLNDNNINKYYNFSMMEIEYLKTI